MYQLGLQLSFGVFGSYYQTCLIFWWLTSIQKCWNAREQISKIEGFHPWSNRINGFGSFVFRLKASSVSPCDLFASFINPWSNVWHAAVTCLLRGLQLSNHSSSWSPLLLLFPSIFALPSSFSLPHFLSTFSCASYYSATTKRFCRVGFQKHCSLL